MTILLCWINTHTSACFYVRASSGIDFLVGSFLNLWYVRRFWFDWAWKWGVYSSGWNTIQSCCHDTLGVCSCFLTGQFLLEVKWWCCALIMRRAFGFIASNRIWGRQVFIFWGFTISEWGLIWCLQIVWVMLVERVIGFV